jgi:hypothetical protein
VKLIKLHTYRDVYSLYGYNRVSHITSKLEIPIVRFTAAVRDLLRMSV